MQTTYRNKLIVIMTHGKLIHFIILLSHATPSSNLASYIPTPEPYNNPKCGLVNIQNKDDKCFEWCLKYHQSTKVKNGDRISVLSKIEDKYNYDNVTYPASPDDIKTFEDNHKVAVNVYVIGEDHSTIL